MGFFLRGLWNKESGIHTKESIIYVGHFEVHTFSFSECRAVGSFKQNAESSSFRRSAFSQTRVRFSKDPVTYRALKTILELRSACREKLLFQIYLRQITATFQAWSVFLLTIQRGLYHPKRFRTFEKRTPGHNKKSQVSYFLPQPLIFRNLIPSLWRIQNILARLLMPKMVDDLYLCQKALEICVLFPPPWMTSRKILGVSSE